MRFVFIVFLVVVVGLAALFVYGQMLEPDTHTIEQEAVGATSP